MKFIAMQRSSAPLVASARPVSAALVTIAPPTDCGQRPSSSSSRRSGDLRDPPCGGARRHRRARAPCRTRRTSGDSAAHFGAAARNWAFSSSLSPARPAIAAATFGSACGEGRVHLAHHRAVHGEPAGDRRAAGRTGAGEQECRERQQPANDRPAARRGRSRRRPRRAAPRRRRSASRSRRWSRSAATSEGR